MTDLISWLYWIASKDKKKYLVALVPESADGSLVDVLEQEDLDVGGVEGLKDLCTSGTSKGALALTAADLGGVGDVGSGSSRGDGDVGGSAGGGAGGHDSCGVGRGGRMDGQVLGDGGRRRGGEGHLCFGERDRECVG